MALRGEGTSSGSHSWRGTALELGGLFRRFPRRGSSHGGQLLRAGACWGPRLCPPALRDQRPGTATELLAVMSAPWETPPRPPRPAPTAGMSEICQRREADSCGSRCDSQGHPPPGLHLQTGAFALCGGGLVGKSLFPQSEQEPRTGHLTVWWALSGSSSRMDARPRGSAPSYLLEGEAQVAGEGGGRVKY